MILGIRIDACGSIALIVRVYIFPKGIRDVEALPVLCYRDHNAIVTTAMLARDTI